MRNTLASDLRSAIESAAGTREPRPERRFHKDDEYLSLGLATPAFREIMRRFRPRFRDLTLPNAFELSARLLSLNVGELGHAGIHLLTLRVDELKPSHFPILDRLMDNFRDWSQVDHFCCHVIQPLLASHPKPALRLLSKWNKSRNRWKRRASVVALTRKAGRFGDFTDDLLRFCETLLWDEEDIVQKGVGWALKDNLRLNPDRILPFIRRARERGASSTITLYAIRDLKGDARKVLLAVGPQPTARPA